MLLPVLKNDWNFFTSCKHLERARSPARVPHVWQAIILRATSGFVLDRASNQVDYFIRDVLHIYLQFLVLVHVVL